MANYSSNKVNELKELLKARGLATNGTKSELVARLEAADSESQAATPAEQPNNESASPDEKAGDAKPEEKSGSTAETESKAETESEAKDTNETTKVEEPVAEPQPEPEPELSDEELMAKVMADLNTQIERAKRFGGDATELEARVKRIQKFGIQSVRDAQKKAATTSKGVSKRPFKGRSGRNNRRGGRKN